MGTYFKPLSVELRREIERGWESTPVESQPVVISLKKKDPADKVVIRPRVGKKPNRGYEEGIEAEERFFAMAKRFKTEGEFPQWLRHIARGTVGDDANGTDAHVKIRTDKGMHHRLPLQIKTSIMGKKKFHAVAKWRHIPCIVIRPEMSDADIFAVLLDEVGYLREQLCRAEDGGA